MTAKDIPSRAPASDGFGSTPPHPHLERLAAIEHNQWMFWSKMIAPEVSKERQKRWKELWIPYEQLSERDKDADRRWANKVIDELGVRPFLSVPHSSAAGESNRERAFVDLVTWLSHRPGRFEDLTLSPFQVLEKINEISRGYAELRQQQKERDRV